MVQVYIEAVRQDQEQTDGDTEDDDELTSGGESLLSLVQSELKNLSNHWLAALRDCALLTLPPGEFSYVLTVVIHHFQQYR